MSVSHLRPRKARYKSSKQGVRYHFQQMHWIRLAAGKYPMKTATKNKLLAEFVEENRRNASSQAIGFPSKAMNIEIRCVRTKEIDEYISICLQLRQHICRFLYILGINYAF